MAWKQQLGEEIAKARRKADMTQDDLHRAVGVSRNTIVKYEKGKTPPPFETLASIASVLKADEFVIEDLHITLSRNGSRRAPSPVPTQLDLNFDEKDGVTVRIEAARHGVVIKKISA